MNFIAILLLTTLIIIVNSSISFASINNTSTNDKNGKLFIIYFIYIRIQILDLFICLNFFFNLDVTINICNLPKSTGLCRGMIPRFYYDSEKKECLRFHYGGCHGNKNRFSTKRICEMKCKSDN